MNFEHLCKTVVLNKDKLKNKKIIKKFISYQYNILKIKKNKLKLGAVTFDFINIFFAEVLIWQEIEMRYIRQDNTKQNELKIENRLKKLNWKWDYSNILAFLIIFGLFFILFIAFIYVWYCNNLPAFAYKDPKYDILVEKSLNILLTFNILKSLKILILSNLILIDCTVALCSFFNVLF